MAEADRRSAFRAWALTWFAYALYYQGRKGFSVSKKTLAGELSLSEATLGAIDTAYLGAYALGQFLCGIAGDRVGARRLVGYGLLGSALCCALFGSASSALVFGLMFLMNGLFQASGWPGTTRAMGEWTTPANRGTVMAFWSTCYQVGGIAANALCAYLLVRHGWRAAFLGPALLLTLMGLAVLLALPNAHRRAGEDSALAADVAACSEEINLVRDAQRAVLRSSLLWSFGVSYFFIKFIRYALLFWLPYFLSTRLGYRADLAANVASAFELGGILGVIGIGIVSDRMGSASRVALSAFALLGLSLSLFVYSRFAAQSVLINALILAAVGACLFGPDSLLSGAAAQDAGGARAFAAATGFVNGLGSIGGMAEGLAVPRISARFGWGALFPSLLVLSLAAAAALLPALLKQRRASVRT
jgi:MFS transporter, OPA family, sugar phosphate sensor protein UhpC